LNSNSNFNFIIYFT